MNMKDIKLFTKAQLERADAASDAIIKELTDQMIAAGRGHELFSETRLKSDALSVAYMAAANHAADISIEMRRRREYHGSLNRIIDAK